MEFVSNHISIDIQHLFCANSIIYNDSKTTKSYVQQRATKSNKSYCETQKNQNFSSVHKQILKIKKNPYSDVKKKIYQYFKLA